MSSTVILFKVVEYYPLVGGKDKIPSLVTGGCGDYDACVYHSWLPTNYRDHGMSTDYATIMSLKKKLEEKNKASVFKIEIQDLL